MGDVCIAFRARVCLSSFLCPLYRPYTLFTEWSHIQMLTSSMSLCYGMLRYVLISCTIKLAGLDTAGRCFCYVCVFYNCVYISIAC